MAVSTHNTSFKDESGNLLYFPPLLLNIPSIRESVDIESRIFKISNISLTVSNIEYNGLPRFSDSVVDIMNAECRIFWKTQSASNLADCLMIYKGKVRRVTHTDTTAKISLEDVTQENLHRDIPVARVSTDVAILDKYKNVPIPICYGIVKDANIVITPADDETENYNGFADDYAKHEIRGYSIDNPLKVFVDNVEGSMNIQKTATRLTGYGDLRQYEIIGDNTLYLINLSEEVIDGSGEATGEIIPLTPLNDRLVEVKFPLKSNNFTINKSDESQGPTSSTSNGALELYDKQNIIEPNTSGFAYVEAIGSNETIFWKHTENGTPFPDNLKRYIKITIDTYIPDDTDEYEEILQEPFYYFKIFINEVISSSSSVKRLDLFVNGNRISDGYGDDHGTKPIDYTTDTEVIYTPADFESMNSSNLQLLLSVGITPFEYWDTDSNIANTLDLSLQIYDMYLQVYAKINNIFKKELYIDLQGRVGTQGVSFNTDYTRKFDFGYQGVQDYTGNYIFFNREDYPTILNTVFIDDSYYLFSNLDGWDKEWMYIKMLSTVITGTQTAYNYEVISESDNFVNIPSNFKNIGQLYHFIEMPCDIIYHLLDEELDYDGVINAEELETARQEHLGWYFSINQTKNINSKKFIENIAKQSKLFPKFRSDDSFGFNTIKDVYTEEDVDFTVYENEIIDYKMDRTKLDYIKTRIRVLYGLDNITKKLLKATEYITAGNMYADYNMDYYGLPDDHSKSTLEIKSDYIQDEGTALRLRNWLISWYCNQHNIIELVLPLKMMTLEIGDIIKFNTILGNVKIYGEDYTVENTRNEQIIYPYFMVYETNKSIDKVTIKLLQMHNHKDEWNYESEMTPATVGVGDLILEQVNNAVA